MHNTRPIYHQSGVQRQPCLEWFGKRKILAAQPGQVCSTCCAKASVYDSHVTGESINHRRWDAVQNESQQMPFAKNMEKLDRARSGSRIDSLNLHSIALSVHWLPRRCWWPGIDLSYFSFASANITVRRKMRKRFRDREISSHCFEATLLTTFYYDWINSDNSQIHDTVRSTITQKTNCTVQRSLHI